MFQSVLVDNPLDQCDVETAYYSKLNKLGNKVLNRHRFGIGNEPDRLKFLQIKNLLAVVNRNDTTAILNKLYNALN